MSEAVTVAEAAQLAGVSARTMRRWVAERKVKSWRVSPRRQYVDRDTALEYADTVAYGSRVR